MHFNTRILLFVLFGLYTLFVFSFHGYLRHNVTPEELRQIRQNGIENKAVNSNDLYIKHTIKHTNKQLKLCNLFERMESIYCSNECERSSQPSYDDMCLPGDFNHECDSWREGSGFNAWNVTQEEISFPLAFSILMHDQPEQTLRLLSIIYRPHNVYCIHVDAGANAYSYDVISDVGKCLDNVYVVSDREKYVHASFSSVAAELKCIKMVLKSQVMWKYYINLAGNDFPLKTNLEMVRILRVFDGANDIESFDYPLLDRWKIDNEFKIHNNASLVQENVNRGIGYTNLNISMGSHYGIFAYNFVKFILQDSVACNITKWMQTVYAPSDSVWATLVTIPWAPGGYPVTVRHLANTYMSRAMVTHQDDRKCFGRYARGKCVFTCHDLTWLQSRHELFASKFDQEIDRRVIACLQKWYSEKARNSFVANIDWGFYAKLPHVMYNRKVRKDASLGIRNAEHIRREWLRRSRTL